MMYNPLHIVVFAALILVITPVTGFGYENPQNTRPDTVTVKVLGPSADSRFEPQVVRVKPGDIIRFDVEEGVHTVTAYHPDNRRDLRIPENADSFDSGILTVGDTWLLTITHTGEYNYFCMPHERMGHVGKIISNRTFLRYTNHL
jgi:plastocyanin